MGNTLETKKKKSIVIGSLHSGSLSKFFIFVLFSFFKENHEQSLTRLNQEFIRLLRSDSGGELLHQYVQASPLCLELMEAWKLRQEKPGLMYVQSLISVILDHPDGKYKSHDIGRITISLRLDKFARSIIETKLEDIYTELNSKETKRQNAALLLMAVVVWHGVGLKAIVWEMHWLLGFLSRGPTHYGL
ncbi:hypothetical protein NE237_004216 [Protea cynaroides]|uniref:Uncharacterized protein n=1 Tax=Protea cynaroides TaxID=273540 RepID=A0A9Q0KIG2_9MAGN|nr:hypothetical protein NE237_004216 [Protea cynaroides]